MNLMSWSRHEGFTSIHEMTTITTNNISRFCLNLVCVFDVLLLHRVEVVYVLLHVDRIFALGLKVLDFLVFLFSC